MNTYIQDKLDEFDKRFVYPLNFDFKVKENEPFLDDSSMADGYGSAADYLKEFLEQSLTDYHNHIVEKIKAMKIPTEEMIYDLRSKCDFERNNTLNEILSLLQDTNINN